MLLLASSRDSCQYQFTFASSIPDSLSKKIQRKPTNIEDMLELASKMSAATVHQYTYGLAYQLNEYTADGTIFDYMAGIRRVS